jgi:hypothetical protein
MKKSKKIISKKLAVALIIFLFASVMYSAYFISAELQEKSYLHVSAGIVMIGVSLGLLLMMIDYYIKTCSQKVRKGVRS